MNRTHQINDSATVEVLIAILDDSEFEGPVNEQFMVIANMEGDTFDGRVRVNPSFVVIPIEDNDVRPGTYVCMLCFLTISPGFINSCRVCIPKDRECRI